MPRFLIVLNAGRDSSVQVHKVDDAKFLGECNGDLDDYASVVFGNDVEWMEVDKDTKFIFSNEFNVNLIMQGDLASHECNICGAMPRYFIDGVNGKTLYYCEDCGDFILLSDMAEALDLEVGEYEPPQKAEQPKPEEDKGLKTYVVDFELAGDVRVKAHDPDEAKQKAAEIGIDALVVQNSHYGENYTDEVKDE